MQKGLFVDETIQPKDPITPCERNAETTRRSYPISGTIPARMTSSNSKRLHPLQLGDINRFPHIVHGSFSAVCGKASFLRLFGGPPASEGFSFSDCWDFDSACPSSVDIGDKCSIWSHNACCRMVVEEFSTFAVG